MQAHLHTTLLAGRHLDSRLAVAESRSWSMTAATGLKGRVERLSSC